MRSSLLKLTLVATGMIMIPALLTPTALANQTLDEKLDEKLDEAFQFLMTYEAGQDRKPPNQILAGTSSRRGRSNPPTPRADASSETS